ncbi:hypothetical protein H257_17234 [Aphanomyces astaci]|uniref:Chromo domain-containing protein n=1 Tax=Aphanomyces astaci TaxID=112090 RepID=W4FFN9_APHAT|nr:hypothetical protein H257_17234 [Aphanomyces astaci]ETV66265.1 hypothetical protein H257_17234 [Aphanomyces astaci]|eukprot:XP_009844252.1 hypothetical protein H257_17234 [Aphanomyces astaci]
MARYQANKLERWALLLSSFSHTIECLPGEDNAWGDLLSRWGALQAQPDFDWTSPVSIVKTQQVTVKRGENEFKNLFLDKENRISIPPSATDLQQRVCIIAHQGTAGHRRIEATTKPSAILSVDSSVVSHPLGSALHAEKPQELIYVDWLSSGSGSCDFGPARQATAYGLLHRFTTFGYVHTWVSDSGYDFKNEVIDKIHKATGSNHHITAIYYAYQRADAARDRLAPRPGPGMWRLESHARSTELAAVTAFTSQSTTTPLSAFVNTVTKEVAYIDWLDATHKKHWTSCIKQWKSCTRSGCPSAKKRHQTRDRQAKAKAVKLQKFAIGDFVLVVRMPHQGNKLSLHWHGPSKIVRVVTDYVMETQRLVRLYDLSLHHARRLKMYSEGDCDVTEDLADHIAFGNEGFHVAKLGNVGEEGGEYQALVYWLGFDEEEASWDPCTPTMYTFPSFSTAGFTNTKTKNK